MWRSTSCPAWFGRLKIPTDTVANRTGHTVVFLDELSESIPIVFDDHPTDQFSIFVDQCGLLC